MSARSRSNLRPGLAAWAAALALAACIPSPTGPEAAPEPSGAQASQEGPAGSSGTPKGCTRTWSAAAQDSLLYCPDPRPPAPR